MNPTTTFLIVHVFEVVPIKSVLSYIIFICAGAGLVLAHQEVINPSTISYLKSGILEKFPVTQRFRFFLGHPVNI